MKPLFMWAGGKNKLIKNHNKFMPSEIDSYSEPFVGGGAMLLYVYENYKPSKMTINDSYSGITNVYSQIKNNLSEFQRILDILELKFISLSHQDRKKFYYEIREKHAYFYHLFSKPEEAAYHYFLQKTGFNGLLQFNKNTNNRFGTPAGLLNQKKQIYSKDLIKDWHNLLQFVTIENKNYKDCNISNYDFVYLDPPYRNSFADYGTSWDDKNTEELIDWMFNAQNSYVIFCNRCDGTSFFSDRKRHLGMESFPVTYTAGRRKKINEKYHAKKATEIILYGKL
jgi:DNA adenine methylase